jgi:hypothetical protein
MSKTERSRRYPPDFGHWHGGPTPHICKIGNDLEESERQAATLDKLRKEHHDALVRRAEQPPTGR